jgi:hypothetical protein
MKEMAHMWRMKVTAVSLIVLGALIFGSVVAYAGWGWNAKVNIEGTMVSTSWTVDGANGSTDHKALIELYVSENADVTVVKVGHKREVFNLPPVDGLACNDGSEGDTPGSVDVTVDYTVTGSGDGEVSVSVNRVGGKLTYAEGKGALGETITLNFNMPGNCKD